MSAVQRTFPKSVQPGIPRLTVTPEGWTKHRFEELFDVVKRPVAMDDDAEYDLVTVKRSRGGIEHRERLPGRKISVKTQFYIREGDFLISKRQIVHGACGIVGQDFDGSIVSNEYSVLVPKPMLRIDYLRYLVHSIYVQQTFFHSSIGVHIEKMIFKLEEWFKWAINLPPLDEQERVAKAFEATDDKLTLLTEKKVALEDYKRGVMQRVFSRALRFTQDDGSAFPDWEERKLGEIAQRSTAKNSDMALARVLTNSATQGVIDQGDYFDKDIANAANIGGYYIVRRGDFVYNPRISVSAPVGPIKRNNLADGVMSPLYTVFRFKADDTDFFTQFFETSAWHRYMHSVANFGARHDRMAITTGDFMAMPLPYPHPDEQRKIADFLSAIVAKIDAASTQISEMETFKKGLLQKMFV